MKVRAKYLIATFLILLTTDLGLVRQQAQVKLEQKPSESTRDALCYRIRHVGYSAPNYPREVLLFISLEPEHFVREDMVSLAYDLRKLYVDEPRFGAIILDDDEAALHTSPIHRKEEYMRARRGFYYWDRTTGQEYIQFSTERGKPWDEIKVILNKSTSSKTN